MSKTVGFRVIAISHADEKNVFIFGAGVYKGRETSPIGFPNPKIELDNGDVVWGYQCWWGREDKVKEDFIGDRTVITVPIPIHEGEE